MNKRAISLKEHCLIYGVGRTKTLEDIASGKLKAFKWGRCIRIRTEDAESWFRAQVEESAEWQAAKRAKVQEKLTVKHRTDTRKGA